MKLARLHGIVALVVVALVLGWWVMRSRSSALDPPTPTAKVEAPSRVDVELAEPQGAAATGTRSAAETTTAPVAARAESPDDWIVLVVDGSTKEPVAGAEVSWTSKGLMPRDSRQPLVDPDPESFLEVDAQWVETDARGLVRLAPDALPGLVCARHGAAFGSASVFERRETRVEVRLLRALHVDIQVVDAGGQPVAGVPVSLRASDAVQGMQPIWTGITAGDAGLARARHFQRGLAPLKPPFELVAGFEFPTRTASTVPVDIEHLPLEPLRLVLPPAGSVEVLVRDSGGGLVPTMSVQLNATMSGEQDFTVTPNLRQFTPASVEKGRVFYPLVETGLELSVQANVNMTFLHASGPGPRVNGERVVFEIDAGPAKPLLVGRLVDESGLPLLDSDVQYALEFTDVGGTARITGGASMLKTTALGRFEVMSAAEAQVPVKGTLSFRSYGGAGGVGLLKLDGPLHEGENDVGDIVVRKPTVLITGRIVDDQGAPLGSSMIDVEVEGSLHGLSTWESDKGTTASCDENGAFKIVSASPQSNVRIRVRKTGYLQLVPCQVASGARDVKIALTKASEISGSLIVEPDILAAGITVFVRALTDPQGDWKQALQNERVKVRPDGTFRLVDVRPIVVDLVARRSGMKEPLVVVPNLDLRGGGAAKDPRLVGIDLRGRMRTGHEERKVDSTPR